MWFDRDGTQSAAVALSGSFGVSAKAPIGNLRSNPGWLRLACPAEFHEKKGPPGIFRHRHAWVDTEASDPSHVDGPVSLEDRGMVYPPLAWSVSLLLLPTEY